jgi:hypothetical protein
MSGPYGEVTSREISITTAGSAGSAVGSGTITVPMGILLDVGINYHASAPNTTDITIAFDDTRWGNILVITSSSTDAVYHPTTVVHTAAGAAVTNGFAPVYLSDQKLTVDVAQCDALTAAVVISLRILEL